MFGLGQKKEEEHKVITLGYDVKITPEGKPYIIEINGKYSGLKGLETITGEKVEKARQGIRKEIAKNFDLSVRQDRFGKKWEDLDKIPKLVSLKVRGKDEILESEMDCDILWDQSGALSLGQRQQRFLDQPAEKQGEFLNDACSKFVVWAYVNRNRFLEIKKYFAKNKYNDPHDAAEVWSLLERISGINSCSDDEELGAIFNANHQTKKQLKILKEFIGFYYQEKANLDPIILKVDQVNLNGKIWLNPNFYMVGENDFHESSEEKPYIKFWEAWQLNSDLLEKLCEDKLGQKKFIPKDFQVFHQVVECPFDPREFLKMMEKQKNKFAENLVVVKKIKGGNCGNEVKIINTEEPGNRAIFKSELWSGYEGEPILMEGFVPSKKIYCDETGDYHDGCMRYLVDLHVVKQRGKLSYEPVYEAGYWRLAPIGSNGRRVFYSQEQETDLDNWKYKVNLANGAIPAMAMADDLAKARRAVMNSVEMIMAKPRLF